MLNSTQAFLNRLEEWVKAIRQDDFETARRCAERLLQDGELLAHHPDFQQCFAKHCGGLDAHQALFHLGQFLLCATEGRSHVLKQYVREPKLGPGS